jgi:hypothetical protein
MTPATAEQQLMPVVRAVVGPITAEHTPMSQQRCGAVARSKQQLTSWSIRSAGGAAKLGHNQPTCVVGAFCVRRMVIFTLLALV